MKRLCFLARDASQARRAISTLRTAGVPDRHLYVVAKHDIDLEDLPDAGPEADDFLPAYERGLALGGTSGLLAGLFAMAFPPAGIAVGGGALVLVTLFGAGLGGLLTGLAGAAFPNSRLEQFEEDINSGAVIVMADVAEKDVARCEEAVRQLGPGIEVEGFEPRAPFIP